MQVVQKDTIHTITDPHLAVNICCISDAAPMLQLTRYTGLNDTRLYYKYLCVN